jgi:hypothetical protein
VGLSRLTTYHGMLSKALAMTMRLLRGDEMIIVTRSINNPRTTQNGPDSHQLLTGGTVGKVALNTDGPFALSKLLHKDPSNVTVILGEIKMQHRDSV